MRVFVTLMLTACVTFSAGAQEPPVEPTKVDFDVIPGNTLVAFTIRDLSDLKRKMSALAKETDGQLASLLSIGASMGPTLLRDHLGMKHSLNESGPAVLAGFGADDSVALLMPITSVADAANAFSVDLEDLEAGKLVRCSKPEWLSFDSWIGVKDRHLVMGHQDAVGKTLHAGGLKKRIDVETQSVFADDDLFLTFDLKTLRELIDEGELQPGAGLLNLVPDGIVELAEGELNRICAGLRVEHGFDGTFVFDFEGETSRKILTKLQNESRKCNLNGLPKGQVVVATSRSSGPESGELIPVASEYFSPGIADLLGLRRLMAPSHVAGMMSVFAEGIKRVQISRAALYRNTNAEQEGAFCLIAILDADNGKDFIQEIREMVPIFNASLYPDRELDEQVDEKTIINMVSFLSHENRRAREFMTAKLRLLGRHALGPLREVAKSDEPQVRSRAEQLIREIESDLSTDRAEFLAGKITKQLQPDFGYIVNFEKRNGHTFDAIRLELEEKDKEVTPQLRTLLGPEWNKIRLTRVNDQVVVMLGSNTSLLDTALENLASGSIGVAAEEPYAQFRQQLPGELMSELHFSMAAAVALAGNTPANDDESTGDSITSMGLSILPQQVRFDFLIPVSEFNTLKNRWD